MVFLEASVLKILSYLFRVKGEGKFVFAHAMKAHKRTEVRLHSFLNLGR